jgi:uncharacterized protein YkwD
MRRLPALLVLALVSFGTVAAASDLADLEQAATDAVNDARRERKLPALTSDPLLDGIARRHSCDMAERGFFQHTTPDGASMADRLSQRGVRYLAAAENLARIDGRDPVPRAVAGWLKSPGHRQNMLSPRFTTTGVGVCRKGRVVYFTQIFIRAR